MFIYVLSYDAPAEYYEKSQYRNFRKEIIKLLLKNEFVNLNSYTKSTIHFSSKFSEEHNSLHQQLLEKFKDLKFSLGVILNYDNNTPHLLKVFDEDFKNEFLEDVIEVKTEK